MKEGTRIGILNKKEEQQPVNEEDEQKFWKISHSLQVTCGSSLFNAWLDSKLVHNRTGHRSDALLSTKKWRKVFLI